MSTKAPIFVLDSSAILAFMFNEDGAAKVEELLRNAEEREVQLILPVIQLGEILYIVERRDGENKRKEADELIKNLPLTFAEINLQIAESAAGFKARGGISYPDAFVIAIALDVEGKILTKDREFKKFEGEVGIEWIS